MPDVTAVLVPGLVSDSRVWKPLAQALAVADCYRIHQADVRHETTIEAMAARLLSRVEGALVVVGHSMGGRVAMEMARQAPGRVKALILANTGHNAAQPGEGEKRQAKIDLGHASMERLAAEWLPPMLDPARSGDGALVADLTEMVLAAGAEVHERQIRALVSRPDAAAYIGDINCPILLMTGAQDSWSPEAQHRAIADLARDAELKVIDNAGHFMPVEQPGETVRTITEWLSRHEETLNG